MNKTVFVLVVKCNRGCEKSVYVCVYWVLSHVVDVYTLFIKGQSLPVKSVWFWCVTVSGNCWWVELLGVCLLTLFIRTPWGVNVFLFISVDYEIKRGSPCHLYLLTFISSFSGQQQSVCKDFDWSILSIFSVIS